MKIIRTAYSERLVANYSKLTPELVCEYERRFAAEADVENFLAWVGLKATPSAVAKAKRVIKAWNEFNHSCDPIDY